MTLIRDGKRIALEFDDHGYATLVVELPSISHARRYVRKKGLVVRRGTFKQLPSATVESCREPRS